MREGFEWWWCRKDSTEKPRVIQQLRTGALFVLLRSEHVQKKVDQRGAEPGRKEHLEPLDLHENLHGVVGVRRERKVTFQHGVENDSESPDIRASSSVGLMAANFWASVVDRSAILLQELLASRKVWLEKWFRKAKVDQFDFSGLVRVHDVFELQVQMADANGVEFIHGDEDLSEDGLGHGFGDSLDY